MNVISPGTGFMTPLDKIQSMQDIGADIQNDDEKSGPSFLDALKSSISEIRAMEQESQQNTYDLAMGNTNDLEGVMIQAAKTSTTIEVTTQIVSKAIGAYKEILQMQV